jgi:trans-aconitate methyltransferase
MTRSHRRSETAPAQRWDPERYRRNASFVAAGGEPVLELLAPQAGERILDLGCGEGALTARIARHSEVVGIDASPEQVASARARGLDARVMDATALPFEREFDAVFSNAALHWMKDLDAVAAGVRRSLKPGGRFVAEMGGEGNVAIVRTAMHRVFARHGVDVAAADPWHFLSVAAGRALLTRHGFAVRFIERFARPTPLPGALADWLDTFAESFLNRLPEVERRPVKAEIEEHLKDRLRDAAGRWTADYVRLRFAAELQSGT